MKSGINCCIQTGSILFRTIGKAIQQFEVDSSKFIFVDKNNICQGFTTSELRPKLQMTHSTAGRFSDIGVDEFLVFTENSVGLQHLHEFLAQEYCEENTKFLKRM
eukprot:766607_1